MAAEIAQGDVPGSGRRIERDRAAELAIAVIQPHLVGRSAGIAKQGIKIAVIVDVAESNAQGAAWPKARSAGDEVTRAVVEPHGRWSTGAGRAIDPAAQQ